MLRNSKLLPSEVTDREWMIQSKLSYDESQALKHIGRWSLSFPKKDINEKWKKARKLYKEGVLEPVKYIMCSTAADAKQKNAIILFFYENSKHEERIKEYGQNLIELFSYKPPSDVSAIYYKSKIYPEKKYLYKIEVSNDESDSD